tara:strand:+ start:1452 stop:2405 length:954 start_codon:yes stop_codon:yes gene_type:complete
MKGMIMKKIILTISALSAALFSTAANADISVSGSANTVYTDAGGNSEAHIGGAVSFSLSTTTDAGMTVSTSAAMTNDKDKKGANNATTGLSSVTFGFASGSITLADDVAVPTGTGLVGELVTYADTNLVTHSNDVKLNGDDDGSGVSATASIGDMTVKGVYVYDDLHGSDVDGGTGTGQGVSVTIPLGSMTATIASASFDDAGSDSSTFGGSLSMAAGGGTLAVGLETSSNDTATHEGEAYSISYSTTLGSASVAIGYTGYDANSTTSSLTDVTFSQSLGGGVSLIGEISSLTGSGAAAPTATTDETQVAIGTTFSF